MRDEIIEDIVEKLCNFNECGWSSDEELLDFCIAIGEQAKIAKEDGR